MIDDEEIVDRPEDLPKQDMTSQSREISDRDRQRARRVLGKIKVAITSKVFLENRSPELLATDLKLAAVLAWATTLLYGASIRLHTDLIGASARFSLHHSSGTDSME